MLKVLNYIKISDMAKICEICGKGSMLLTPRNKLRGKYNPSDKKRKYPNIQRVFLLARRSLGESGSSEKRVRACVQCIKTLSKPKKK